MSSRLAERLASARRRSFVGRAAEIDLLRQALRAPESEFYVVHVFGPGGVGKSTLLKEMRRVTTEEGATPILLDGLNIPPSADGFVDALRLALQPLVPGSAANDPVELLMELAAQARCVLLVDSYELLTPLDGWLRDTFLPQLPDGTLVVLAGRNPPTYGWKADPGWQEITRALQLGNLSADEALDYLGRRHVAADKQQEVLTFTRGHPLALSLAAEVLSQQPETSFGGSTPPDVIRALLQRFMHDIESPRPRAALEAAAILRVTTEPLLAAMLDITEDEAHPLFEWLRGLSFISAGLRGLYPHDLAREALLTDLRWRNPDLYAELHRRARRYYYGRLKVVQGYEKPATLLDMIYLHESPLLRALFVWNEFGGLTEDQPRRDDWAPLAAMVERHEGAEAWALARLWFARQPESVLVIRGPDGYPQGFICFLALREADMDLIQQDPAAQVVWDYLGGSKGQAETGEITALVRWWLAAETYQAVSPAQGLIWVAAARLVLTTPRLLQSFHVFFAPDAWTPVLDGIDLHRIPEVDFTLGERQYGMFQHNWVDCPPDQWLALLADREMSNQISGQQSAESVVPEFSMRAALAEAARITDLGENEFTAALRDALRSLTSPAALADNPLARSRIVSAQVAAGASPAERGEALRALLLATIGPLEKNARDARLYRALYHTYISPATSQEAAAELADVPFSTFRRHLKEGIERVCAELWARERAV